MASLGGTWGSEIKKQMKLESNDAEMYETVANKSFSLESCTADKSYQDNKYYKFRSIQANGLAVLQYPVTEGEKKSPIMREEKELSMSKTRFMLLRQSDAPVAVGRSGLRIENGLSASGLIGEKLNTSEELAKNSYVQRSWLGYDDPSLMYKTNGIPVASRTTELSLDLGEDENGSKKYVAGNFRRTACITSPSKAGLFADEY